MTNTVFADEAAFLNKVAELGREEGDGKLARPEFIIQLATAAHEGTIVLDMSQKPDAAARAWARFSDNAKRKTAGFVRPDTRDEKMKLDKDGKATPQRVSELRQVINASAPPMLDFANTLVNARGLIAGGLGKSSINVSDAFIVLARAQIKIGQDRDLSSDEIVTALTPLAKKKLTPLDRIKKLEKGTVRVIEGSKDEEEPEAGFEHPALTAALANLRECIADLEIKKLDEEREAKVAAIQLHRSKGATTLPALGVSGLAKNADVVLLRNGEEVANEAA